MDTIQPIAAQTSQGNVLSGRLTYEAGSSSDNIAQFQAALERQMAPGVGSAADGPGRNTPSLGEKMATRVNDLASDTKKDQQYVSKLLEQATRSGDSMQLMKAMMALNDYQVRVQVISKTVSKATQAVEQLTKLQ